MVAITERGLNELIRTGRLPLASKYNGWIIQQVLPALRENALEEKTLALPDKEVVKANPVMEIPEMSDPINVFRVLLNFADKHGFKVKSKPFQGCKSMLHQDRIGVKKGMTLEEVNYEIAFELAHAIMHYDQGDMVRSPLAKIYNQQAEMAARMLIEMIDSKCQIA